jgi:two-component sensor histidine kinase
VTPLGKPEDRTLGSTTLPAALASVPAARRFAVRCLSEEHASPDACDAVALLTAEVVTNAILHAVSPVTVTVAVNSQEVARISVHDDDPRRPVVHNHGADASTGRGMRLVEAISAAWGAEVEPIGKTVWFEVPVHASAAETEPSFDDLPDWSEVEPL